MNIFARAKAEHLKLGRRGEDLAVKLFRRRNCVILWRNWRNNLLHDGIGELDSVLMDGETLVFAEVKTRRKLDNYLPGANLSISQKKRIQRGARAYCRQFNVGSDVAKRFDLVEIIHDGKRMRNIALHENYMPFFQGEFLTQP